MLRRLMLLALFTGLVSPAAAFDGETRGFMLGGGVGGTMAGLPWLDAVAAIVVALMIAKIAWDLLWKSLQELIDTALDAEQVETISETIRDVPGVRSLHMLRTRRHGAEASADVHVQVAPRLSVSEGHMISQAVEDRLIEKVESITDVTVHIDPEDDEQASPCTHLPLRNEILRRLEAWWGGLESPPQVEKVVLHYLGGKVHVDLYLGKPSGTAQELDARATAIREAARQARYQGDANQPEENTAPPAFGI